MRAVSLFLFGDSAAHRSSGKVAGFLSRKDAKDTKGSTRFHGSCFKAAPVLKLGTGWVEEAPHLPHPDSAVCCFRARVKQAALLVHKDPAWWSGT